MASNNWAWLLAAAGLGGALLGAKSGEARASVPSPVTKIVTWNGMRVLVHVPATLRHLRIVVYLHGHGDKIETIRDTLLVKWDKAQNPAIIIAPQLGSLSEPGVLAQKGALTSLLASTISGPVALMAHSGGYVAAAALIRDNVSSIKKTGLLDALYGEMSTYLAFIRRAQRFINIYGPSTEENSLALIDHFPESVWLNTTPLDTPDLEHMIQFKISTFATSVFHPSIPAVYGAAMIDGLS